MTDPKYQISCFPGNDKGTQWVVRSDDFDEIQKMKAEMEGLYGGQTSIPSVTTRPVAVQTQLEKDVNESLEPAAEKTCWKCGEPATFRRGVSKAGKPWKAFFCSTDDKSHVEWV